MTNKEVVALCERADGAAFAFGEAAFGALHQLPAPGIRRRIADGAEHGQPGRRRERAPSQRKSRFQGKAIGVAEPAVFIFEQDGLRAANAIAPCQPDLPGASVQIDMDLEVSHRGTRGPAA